MIIDVGFADFFMYFLLMLFAFIMPFLIIFQMLLLFAAFWLGGREYHKV